MINKLKSWATKILSKEERKESKMLLTHNEEKTAQTISLDFLKIRTFKIVKSA